MYPKGDSSVYMRVWVVFPINSTPKVVKKGRSDIGEDTTGNGKPLFPKYRFHQKNLEHVTSNMG